MIIVKANSRRASLMAFFCSSFDLYRKINDQNTIFTMINPNNIIPAVKGNIRRYSMIKAKTTSKNYEPFSTTATALRYPQGTSINYTNSQKKKQQLND